MSTAARCPECHAPLPPGVPAGCCPACLMALGLGAPPPTPAHGSRISENLAGLLPGFEFLGLLGEGGMGTVYQARQTSLDRLVAIKVIKPDASRDPDFAERFTREARALARLNHAHIVTVHDFGQRDGLYYLVMEYVDGTNLRELLDAGRLSPEQALAVIPPLCAALQYAHDQGIVHRDIKPENILIDRAGRVKIADFGLAKLAGTSEYDYRLTQTRQIVGTPRYMAPEQMQGARRVDHRADIYSLGVVFYEMLTGELPMGRFEPPSHRVHVDARLDEVVLRALERDPDRRYQRANDIKTDIETIAERPHSREPVRREGQGRSTVAAPGKAAHSRPSRAPGIALSLVAGMQVSCGGILLARCLATQPAFVPRYLLLMGASSLLFGLLIIVGAASLELNRRVTFLARLGAVAAMVPTSPVWLAGLPVGIWVLLSEPRDVHSVAPERPPSKAPFVCLLLAGLLQAGISGGVLLMYLTVWMDPQASMRSGMVGPVVFLFVLELAGLLTGAAAVVGAINLLTHRSAAVGQLGALALLFPTGPQCLLGIPVGIWVLLVTGRRAETALQELLPAPPITPVPPITPEPAAAETYVPYRERSPSALQAPSGWSLIADWMPTRGRHPWRSIVLIALIAAAAVTAAMLVRTRARASLLDAARRGDADSVAWWLSLGVSTEVTDAEGMTPLMWAAWEDYTSAADVLFAHHANVDAQTPLGETALMKAAFRGHTDIVQKLRSHGAQLDRVDRHGETALIRAAANGHVATVDALLQPGSTRPANVDLADSQGMTPLMWAAWHGRVPVVQKLFGFNASVYGRSNDGESVLMKAAWQGHGIIVQELLEHGATIGVRDNDGETALILAAFRGHDPIVKTLLEHGEDPHAETREGLTPLMVAALNGYADVVHTLLPVSDASAVSKAGQTALSLAVRQGHEDVIKVLLSEGAEGEGPLWLWRGYRLAHHGQYAEALPDLEKAATAAQTATRAWQFMDDGWLYEAPDPATLTLLLLGECRHRTGDDAGASAAFRQVLERIPAPADPLILYSKHRAEPGIRNLEEYAVRHEIIREHADTPARGWVLARKDRHVSESGGSRSVVASAFASTATDLFQ